MRKQHSSRQYSSKSVLSIPHEICETNPTTLPHSSTDITSTYHFHTDNAQQPFSSICYVHLPVNRTAPQHLQQQYVPAGQNIITDPFIQLNIPDEKKDNPISQEQMPPSPTDEVSIENIITEHEVVVQTVVYGLGFLHSCLYMVPFLFNQIN